MREFGVKPRRIVGFGLNSPDAARLTAFYATAFGALQLSSEHLSGKRFERRMGVRGRGLLHTLQLGRETIDIMQFGAPGRSYPRPLSPDDTEFQHFALVVCDMALALTHLRSVPGWTSISTGGAQRLPQRSGGVTAFKFQDPDGHPLELLAFPEHAVPPCWMERSAHRNFLGIDHSALSVRDTAISTTFYRSLGFSVTAQTLNYGEEQADLDGVPSPQVEVTTLCLATSTPHLELLCYRSATRPPQLLLSSNDVAATRIVLAGDSKVDVDSARQLIVDPDGHHLLLESPARGVN